MKHIHKNCVLFFILISISATSYSQQQPPMSDTLGLPGDNLNLYGVLYLFKESVSVQDFEVNNGGGRQGNFNNQPRQQVAPRQEPRNMGGGGGRMNGGGNHGGGRRR